MHSRNSAIEAARGFVSEIKRGGIRVSQAFVFGSYAHGVPRTESDIDVAVVSPDFSGFRFDDLGRIAGPKLASCADIEVHPFAEKDFTPDNPFVALILQTGLRVA